MSLFSSPKWLTHDNQVSDYWTKLSDNCKPFNLEVPIEKSWRHSDTRVLFVIGDVPSEDLKNKKLLSGKALTLLSNCLDYAKKIAKPYGYKEESTSYAAINFNYFRTFHLDNKARAQADQDAANRVRAFIKKANPTHILLMGDFPAKTVLQDIVTLVPEKKGWVHEVKLEGKTRKVVTTIDYTVAIAKAATEDDDDDDFDNDAALKGAYVLGYFCRSLRNLLLGFLPHNLKDIKPNTYLVDTIKKFDKMMADLNKSNVVAFDTETSNLNKIANKLLVLQFATSTDRGYVLPYMHKDTPFSSKELEYIKKELRSFFLKRVPMQHSKYLVAFNGKFDLTVVKQALGIPFVYWPVFDCQAGAHALDETMRYLESFSETPHGNLAQIFCSYGNAYYFEAEFSKKNRSDMDNTSLSDQSFLDYCAIDVTGILALHNAQIAQAKKTFSVENGEKTSYYKDFMNVVLTQMSNNIQVFASMEHRGIHLDRKHVSFLKTKESPISQAIYKYAKSFNKTEEAVQANDILLAEEGVDTSKGGLFDIKPWIFSIDKPAHKLTLFFQVLGLKPISFGKAGQPKLDKNFKSTYKDNEMVKMLSDFEKLKKLKSSYVDAFARFLNEADGKTDSRLRPQFGFFKVLSGRSNSDSPSLQQVPQHGDNAHHIKRMFAPQKGWLIIKLDYSAHEVRCWSIMTGDKKLAELFAIGRRLRQKLFKTADKEYALELQLKGDVHRLNANNFFGTPIPEVTGEQRQATKGVVFGLMYGKSYKTLAKDIKKAAEYAKELYTTFFNKFKVASNWLETTKAFGRLNMFAKSALGRRRHLFGHLLGDKSVSGAMDRRSQNSPIQGMGADFGHTGSRLTEMNLYDYALKTKQLTQESTSTLGPEIMVHDSVFTSCPFKNVLATAQIMQWCTTMGVQHYYLKHFDLPFTVPLEIEMEFGARQDMTYKWLWTIDTKYDPEIHEWNDYLAEKNGYTSVDEKTWSKGKQQGKKIAEGFYCLKHCLQLALKDHCELHKDVDYKKAWKTLWDDWYASKEKKLVDKYYPILPDFEPSDEPFPYAPLTKFEEL